MGRTKLSLIVKALRKEYGITQEELAMKSGVGLCFVRNLEQGKTSLRMDKVNQLLDLFNYELTATKRSWDKLKYIARAYWPAYWRRMAANTDADSRGLYNITMIDDTEMAKIVWSNSKFYKEYLSESDAAKRLKPEHVYPILKEAGLFKKVKQNEREGYTVEEVKEE